MKKTLQKTGVIAIAMLMSLTLAVPNTTSAQTTTAQLQAMILQLQAQLNALLGVGTTAPSYTYTRDLTIGSTGSDVVTLQTFLETRGHLVMPAGVSKGYFGAITQSALGRYQASVGISPTSGYFGPITRTHFNSMTVVTPPVMPPTTPTNPGSGLSGGDGDIRDISKTTSGTETTVREGRSEDVLGFDIEADDNSDLEVSSIRVKITVGSDGSNRLDRYLDEVMVIYEGDEVGSIDVRDFSRRGSVHTATISLDDTIIESGEEGRFYINLTARDSINDSDLDNTLLVEVDRVRVSDASGAILTESVTGVDTTVDFEDSTVGDDARIKSSSDNRNAGLLKIDANKASDEFDILSFEFNVDDNSSDLVVIGIQVELEITNASTTAALDVNRFIQDMYLEVDGQDYDDFTFNDTSVAANATETIIATFTIDEGDLEIMEGDIVDAVVFVKFGRQAGNYAEGTKIKATVRGSDITAENTDGDLFEVSGTATGKVQTVQISTATVEDFAWSNSKNNNNSTGLFTFTFNVTADDEDFTFDQSSLVYATSGTATISGASWAIITGSDNVDTNGSEYIVTEGEDATFQVSFNVTGPGSAAVAVTSVANQTVPSNDQYSGLESF